MASREHGAEILILPVSRGSAAPVTRPVAAPIVDDARRQFNDTVAELDVLLCRAVERLDAAGGAARAAVIAGRAAFMKEWRRRARAKLVRL
jgi:hypothetical protein